MKTALQAYGSKSRNIFPFSMEKCALYLPLWQEDMQGSTLLSYDRYLNSCAVTGATWGANGRTFDGNDDVSLGSPSQLDITGSLTIIVLFKTAGTGRLVTKETSDWNTPWLLHLTAAGKFAFFTSNSVPNEYAQALSVGAYNDNVWHHAVARHDSTTARIGIYIDYADYVEAAWTRGIKSSAETILVGASMYGGVKTGWLTSGIIREVWVFNTALSGYEIDQHRRITKPVS